MKALVMVMIAVGVASQSKRLPIYVSSAGLATLSQSDFTFLGAFKVPHGTIGNDVLHDSSNTGYFYQDPINGKTFYMACNESGGAANQHSNFAQLGIPALLDPAIVGIAGLNTASTIAGCADPSNGKVYTYLNPSGVTAWSAVAESGGKLIGASTLTYDGGCAAYPKTAWVGSTDLSDASSATGLYEWNSAVYQRHIGGIFFGLLPAASQAAFGGRTLVSGSGPMSIVSCYSTGPALWSVDAATMITQPATSTKFDVTPLVYYPYAHQCLGLWDFHETDPTAQTACGIAALYKTSTDPETGLTRTHPYINGSSRITGMIWAEGRDVVVTGILGIGRYGYGQGVSSNPPSPVTDGRWCTGSNASTDATGLILTVPNCNVNDIDVSEGTNTPYWAALTSETTPNYDPSCSTNTTDHPGASAILARANSGTPTAQVTVEQAFRPNLTGQAYRLGERTCYDPSDLNPGGHAYPSVFVSWIYRASDLLLAKQGSVNPWNVLPYALWTWDFSAYTPVLNSSDYRMGAVYDPGTRRAYLLVGGADGSYPVAFVYSVR